jgi:hypothetical protein
MVVKAFLENRFKNRVVDSVEASAEIGFVANFAQEVMKGQWPWSVEGITRPGNRTVQPQ